MNLDNKYWYFKSALPLKLCDDIIRFALEKKETRAVIGGIGAKKKLSKDDIKNIQRKRKSDLVWLSEPWITKEIQPYVHQANVNAGWNFNWDSSEEYQFTKYKTGQYYDWHCDSWEKPYQKDNYKGKIRKLSVTCQLTDGSEYTGGELEFDFRNYDPHMRDESKHVVQFKGVLPKGSIVVFPSHTWHRVKPITSGTRYSLVVWNLGLPFK